jgi:hypothetical protein
VILRTALVYIRDYPLRARVGSPAETLFITILCFAGPSEMEKSGSFVLTESIAGRRTRIERPIEFG